MEALENLDVWKRACQLAVAVYQVTRDCRDRGYRDQLTRAALSIPSNIAEGYERDSLKSRVYFLRIAKGSCGELWTQLLVGRAAGLIPEAEARRLELDAKQLSRMLFGLVRYNLMRVRSEADLAASS